MQGPKPAVKERVPGKGRQAEKDCLASQVHRSQLDHNANSEQVAAAGKEEEKEAKGSQKSRSYPNLRVYASARGLAGKGCFPKQIKRKIKE